MKLFKTVLAASAVAAIMSSCTSVTDADDGKLADHGITKMTGAVFNSQGGTDAKSGFDIVKGQNVSGSGANTDGTPKYTPADSARVDFRSINSNNRFASTLTSRMTSVNNTKFAVVSQADYEEVTKSIKSFATKLKNIADTASSKSISFSTSSPYYVAKLVGTNGEKRGYALVKTTAFDSVDVSLTSQTNVGSLKFDYFYMTDSAATAEYK